MPSATSIAGGDGLAQQGDEAPHPSEVKQYALTPSRWPEIRFPMNGLAATQLFPEAAPDLRGGSGGFLLECHEVTEALDVIAARST